MGEKALGCAHAIGENGLNGEWLRGYVGNFLRRGSGIRQELCARWRWERVRGWWFLVLCWVVGGEGVDRAQEHEVAGGDAGV
jgi:hypothetical protein